MDIDFFCEVRIVVLDDLKSVLVKYIFEVLNGYLFDCCFVWWVFFWGRGYIVELVDKRDIFYFVGFIGDIRKLSELDDGIRK